MKDHKSLSHTSWDCKYQLAWIPTCRKKVFYGCQGLFIGFETTSAEGLKEANKNLEFE